MNALITALYTEGRTDERFLPGILQRTLVELLARRANRIVEVWHPILLQPDQKNTHAEDIVAVARKAADYHLLFVHADADRPTRDKAFSERVQPGMQMVQARLLSGDSICRELVPVIPVQMVEAWMLADPEALRATVGTHLGAAELGIPLPSHEIEGEAQPKDRLSDVVRIAYAHRTRRRRKVDVRELYQPLADQISLTNLNRLPSYQQLVSDLTTTLTSLGFISN